MHYAKHVSRGSSLDDSGHEGSDLSLNIPDHVFPEIIPIPDPKLLYVNAHAERDRRLRLLIRRYSNQIQYGCRNVNCTTPTCLSYRKRNSTGPLRRYTELSARTLACQLVEECTRNGKEPLSGLCQNDPVVPWYEDPAVTKKRRNSLERLGHHRYENGHLPKCPTTIQRHKESTRNGSGTEHALPRRPTQDGIVQAGRHLRSLDVTKNDEEIAEGIINILNSSFTKDRPIKEGQEEGEEGDAKDNILHASPAPPKQKDMASFTQTLFDMVPLRLLSWLPARTRPPSESSKLPDDPEIQQQDVPNKEVSETDNPAGDRVGVSKASSTGHQCESLNDRTSLNYSLRTLTWNSMTWMRSMQRTEDQEVYQRKYLPFLKQSLFYCLNDPERLIRSIKNFQDSYGPQRKKTKPENETSGSPASNLPSNHSQRDLVNSNPWPMISTRTKFDMEALLASLSYLDNFGQRDLILNCIFTALQHSYRLPSWLQDRSSGKHGRSTSGSGEGASLMERKLSHTTITHDILCNPSTQPGSPLENGKLLVPLKDNQVTEMCLVALMSIASLIFDGRHRDFWGQKVSFSRFAALRNSGLAHSRWPKNVGADETKQWTLQLVGSMIKAIDVCEDWSVLRLLTAIMDIISHRLTVAKWTANLKKPSSPKAAKRTIVESLIDRFDRDTLEGWDEFEKNSSWIGTAVIELARTVILKNWDRRPIIRRAGPVGGALELLAGIYRERKELNLDLDLFHMPFIADTFDELSMPSEWLSFRADTRHMHLLSFSFLFEPATLVRYFRAVNIEMMRKSHENATLVYNDTRHYMWAPAIPIYGATEILTHLRPHMAKFFVLTIRRDNVLNDAINQIWRRQRRELMRPLRVRLGKDEGEDGLDHGGVQQEFFRVVFAEALRPDYGMFTVDSTTRMTWFQPGSFEQLYRFEALGILMSIAVYNGITLPVTLPLAFYRKILGLKVKKLEHIADGWPDLTRGLRALLEWADGDVGDVIARTYEFSYDLCGSTVTVDMQKIGRDDPWPPARARRSSKKGKEKSKSTSFELPIEPTLTPPAQPSPNLNPTIVPVLSRTSSVEIKGISTPSSIDSDMLAEEAGAGASLVTNANRTQYVKDYILWLTHKSIEPQYEAFAKGFYTCLDRTALSIFTPEALKSVVEGYPDIDIDELERTITYDEYDKESPTIVDFWHVVRSFSPEQHRQLLEFVTASDRVPVNGIKSIQFIVQKNGDDDNRLPSSSTCYGRLLLPQYSSRQVLEEKLTKAIENCVGFGTL
ncbi:uncharacterized protein Z518_03873 [Rhinocladiella mackenziei CBS 650.93]|uniref:HECT-type E3 ubiquitin transferase n=1 Tax=Rhinocladiella mackenziei CBS 650.93 TaxID=1442369 RepID=A0A0D2J9V4_9EURO|nr:uncharacterized protein Z518_03873 [Rhinocladiella mackenziei CBS 650.93]KIX05900.1 hypothetical protein Z518_03873 [Rhinocladiella mackenziei CBS 650.93]